MIMNNRLIDFHSHILPGADHGSANAKTTEKQLSLIRKEPVAKIVATPHFYPHQDNLSSFVKKREESVRQLVSVINFDVPEIFLGAEVLLCPGLDQMNGLERLCIEGTNTCLLYTSEKYLQNINFKDRVYRSYGILKEARILSSAEFLKLVSDVRMGAAAGILDIDTETLDSLFIKVQPYNIMLFGRESLEVVQRDMKRADLVRETLKND